MPYLDPLGFPIPTTGGIIPAKPLVYSPSDIAAIGSAAAATGLGAPATPSSTPPANENTIGGYLLQNIPGNLGNEVLAIGNAITGNAPVNNSIPGLQSVVNTAQSLGSALAFITDIPRVTTAVVGLVLVIAGIFALSRGPAVQIVTTAARDTLTS